MSFARLGEDHGIPAEGVRKIIMNPIYNGWAVRSSARHGRADTEQRVAAGWRDNPPVNDELWRRVCDVRRQHYHGGAPRRRDRFDPLGGLIYCTCGRYVRANGLDGNRRHQRIHAGSCPAWGARRTYVTDVWYRPMLAQVSAMQLDNRTIHRVVRLLTAPPPASDELRRKRLEAHRRQLANDYSAGKIGKPEFLSGVAAIRQQEAQTPPMPKAVGAAAVVRRLRDFAALWASQSDAQRAQMLRNVYERVEVEGPKFVGAHLTADAKELGLTLALPESFVMASPAGFEPATGRLEGGCSGPLSYGDNG